MKYIVMECHYSYAVLLDEEGRFIKAANFRYEVGQTVTNIVEMQIPEPEPVKPKKSTKRIITGFASMAACMILMFTIFFQTNLATYASVYMTINPEVRIDVNKKNIVVGLEGINDDGKDLIEDYSYKKKSLDPVMDELIDLAIEKGYLSSGDRISLVLDADSDEWILKTEDELDTHLNTYLNDKLSVTIEIEDTKNVTPPKNQSITIPVTPKDDSDYDSSDYGSSASTKKPSATTAASDYADSGYDNTDSEDSNSSNYDDSNYDTDSEDDSSYDD